MFRPEKMCFVNISVLDEHLVFVLDRLAKLGVMHVVDKTEIPSNTIRLSDVDVDPLRSRFTTINSRLEKLSTNLSIDRKITLTQAGISEEKLEIDPFNIGDRIENELAEIEALVEPIVQQIGQIQSEIRVLEENSQRLHILDVQGVNLDDLRNMRFLYFAYGEIPEENYQRLVGSLAHLPCVLMRGSVYSGRLQIMTFSVISDKESLMNALEAAYFTKIELPERYHGSIADILDEIELKIWAKREEMAELYGQIRILRRKWRNRILELMSTVSANQIVIDSMEKFGKTDKSYLLSGWVPYKDVKKLQKEFEKIPTQGLLMDASEPITAQEAENHKPLVPTKLQHPSFLRPFSGLVTNFGIPKYSDIDPTVFASLSFLAMFGVMFADVGHGSVLIILGILGALYPLPQLRSIKNMSIFIAACGFASVITGLLFGNLFGKEDIIKPLWFSLEHMDPEHVNHMLKLGVYFGIFMLSLGVMLNIAQSFRRKNFKEAFCGQWGIFSLASYWTAVFLLITGRKFSWQKILLIIMLMLPIVLKEPVSKLFNRKQHHGDEEKESESLIESGFQVYEVVMAYLANTLSYIRIAAFDLSHAGLMMATYSLTKELGGSDNLFISLPSDIMANAFVILLEGLISAIQCMRLEYYEFFSKFFAGEGVEYKPLKIS
ncbi:MAG: V-type ATP synthase subunit I [bacterium]